MQAGSSPLQMSCSTPIVECIELQRCVMRSIGRNGSAAMVSTRRAVPPSLEVGRQIDRIPLARQGPCRLSLGGQMRVQKMPARIEVRHAKPLRCPAARIPSSSGTRTRSAPYRSTAAAIASRGALTPVTSTASTELSMASNDFVTGTPTKRSALDRTSTTAAMVMSRSSAQMRAISARSDTPRIAMREIPPCTSGNQNGRVVLLRLSKQRKGVRQILNCQTRLFGKTIGGQIIGIAASRSIADFDQTFIDAAPEISVDQADSYAEFRRQPALRLLAPATHRFERTQHDPRLLGIDRF